MAHKLITELHSLDSEALNSELNSTCKEYLELSLKHKAGSLKQTHLIKACRRQIARLNTLLQSKRS